MVKLVRRWFTEVSSIGQLYFDETPFCYTLEDASRGENVKIKGKTSIPTGTYEIKITFSNRFQKLMPLIFNMPDMSLQNKGIRFDGVRIHSGNTNENTEGCILVAYKKENNDKIYSSASNDVFNKLTELLKQYNHVYIEIENLVYNA